MIGLRQKAGARRSRRRSGIEGALPFRGGAGDHNEIRLAGTPAGRFAAIMQAAPLHSSTGLQGAEGWSGSLFLPGKKRDSPERTQAGAVTGLGGIYGMDCCW